jgi:hypothetical protein
MTCEGDRRGGGSWGELDFFSSFSGGPAEKKRERDRRDERRGHEMVVKREGHSGIHTETHEGGRERDCHCHDPYVKSDRGPSLDK